MNHTAFPDARTLIVLVLLLTSLAIAINSLLGLSILLAVSLAVLLVARIPLPGLLRRMQRYRWLFFILAVVQSVTNPSGQVYLAWRGCTLLSVGGLLSALLVLVRITIIMAAALLLTRKDYQQLVTGLVQMKVPYELAYMVLLGIRFIPVLMDEFRNSLTAIQLRGVDLHRIPLGEKIKVYYYILMPTVAGALIRARRIATAMEARAFRARKARTWLEWPVFTGLDWLIVFAALAGGAGLLWIAYRGAGI